MGKDTGSAKYYIMVVLGVIIFSTFEVITKTMNGALSGALLTFYRFLIGGLVLLPFAARDMKKKKVRFTGKFCLQLLLFSFLLVFVSMTLAQYGIFYSSASISAVIFSSNPLFVAFFAAAILKERLTVNKVTGLLVGVAGLFLTCANLIFGKPAGGKFVLGVILTICSMIIFCVYTVFNKKSISPVVGPVAATALTSIVGAITLIPLVIYQGMAKGVNPFAFPLMSVWPQFLYSAIIGTGIAYLLYFAGLAKIDAGTGSMIFLIKPPLASIFAALILKEAITPNIVAGIVLILVGMFVAVRLKPRSLHRAAETVHTP